MISQGRHLIRETRRDLARGYLLAGILTVFANSLLLLVPLYSMEVFDRVLNSRNMDTHLMLTLLVCGGLLLFGLVEFLRARTYLVMAHMLSHRLNVPALHAAIVEQLKGRGGNALQALRHLNDLRSFLVGTAIGTPVELMMVPLLLVVLFLIHPVYGFLATGGVILLAVVGVVNDLLARVQLRNANEAAGHAMGEVAAAIRHAEVIEGMGMLPTLARRWTSMQDDAFARLDRGSAILKAAAAVARTLNMLMRVGVIAVGVILILNRELSSGTMFGVTLLISRVLLPFDSLIEGWRQWMFAAAAWRQVAGLLEAADDGRHRFALPKPPARLTVDQVLYMPPGVDRPLLQGVSFALEPGEVLGVVGASAAGKSTLARLVIGLWQPTSGGIYLDGHNVALWERESFGAVVGYVPQNVAMLNGTIRENIARMRLDASPGAVIAAARQAGVHEMIGRLPNGYETHLGDGGHTLSGGQRQRIALARALFGDPALLVLDEPNSNLDHEGEQALLKAVAGAKARGAVVVMIAHRPSVMEIADRLLVLREGRVDQYGPRTDIIKVITPKVAVRRLNAT